LHFWQSFTRAEKTLVVVFLLSLPFIQPQVQGDGIGYYAYARSMLIDHNLNFEGDWKDAKTGDAVVVGRENGHVQWSHYTKIGHRVDHFSVGPAMLWAPFLVATHLAVLGLNHIGWAIPADGYSRPYLLTMAAATVLYGFMGLWFSFQLARSHFEERWAFLATVGIWFASSMPAYMYKDPSWAHAHSVFAGALFLWYWHRTLGKRTLFQWLILGLISGLMLDIYYANFVFLLAPLIESLMDALQAWQKPGRDFSAIRRILGLNVLFSVSAVVAFLPTLITRQIIFGNPFGMGLYTEWHWNWDHPAFLPILFSHNRGLVIWTPILLPAVAGLFVLRRREPKMGGIFLAIAAAYYALIATYPWWDGISSFGNRYFITLTPLYIVGLAAAFAGLASYWKDQHAAYRRAVAVTSLLVIWNLGLVYQWSTGLLPERGPVYWNEVVYNQFRVVPGQLARSVYVRFAGRGAGRGAEE
jgi:hypothetical protein